MFKRDLKIRASYRMTLIMGVVTSVSGLLMYGLLGNSASTSVTSEAYNMDLASYLVSGVAFSSIINGGPALFSQHSSPTELEEVLVTPTGFLEYVLTASILSIMTSVLGAVFFFAVGTFLLGLDFSYNLPLLSVMGFLGITSSIGLGFIGLGLRLVYKQASLLSWVLFSMTGILGNMLVPIQVLPQAIQAISYLTPQYYFFTGIRLALGGSDSDSGSLVFVFSFYTIVLVALGLYAVRRGLRHVKRTGTHRWT